VFTIYENQTFTRDTIETTKETWILEVVHKLNGDFSADRKEVKLNNTLYVLLLFFSLSYCLLNIRYYLQVVEWSEIAGIDWYFVLLLEESQFLGNSNAYFVYVFLIFLIFYFAFFYISINTRKGNLSLLLHC